LDDAVLGDGACVDTLCGEAVRGVAVPVAVERLILLLDVAPSVMVVPFLVGGTSSPAAAEGRMTPLPASKPDGAFGEPERVAMSGWLLDVLVCLDGTSEAGRGGTG
jgi:hypothetical protein